MRWRRKGGDLQAIWLREQCERRVDALGLPVGKKLSVDALCEHLSRLSGRPIQLMPFPLPLGSPDGLWVSAAGAEYVIYEQRLAPVHQQQVVLHELGHLICDHEATPVLTPEASRLLLPSLDPDLIRRTLGREHSQSSAEVEAEYIGTLIGRRIGTWTTEQVRPVPPEMQELAARLSALDNPAFRGSNE
ncbi:ImmA/IrrE family metallo-endopeptidase [Streptomyces sp. NPDC048196]|uniref:ImmA/IrrE family metallo-endopeptidase n=1 Tax=Streptomyces sp. NPDC048196 TaxID=3154712 RepID=UPI0033F5D66F